MIFATTPAPTVRPPSRIAKRRPSSIATGLISVTAIFRSEEHTSELQSLMRISYAVFCLKKKNTKHKIQQPHNRKSTDHSTNPKHDTHNDDQSTTKAEQSKPNG